MRNVVCELALLAGGLFASGLLLKIFFTLTDAVEIIRIITGVGWLFLLPGYCIMLPWRDRFELKERIVVGMLTVGALFAVMSYYSGLLGLHIRTHTVIFPAIMVTAGLLFVWRQHQATRQASLAG